MNTHLLENIRNVVLQGISEERKLVLQLLIDFIQDKVDNQEIVNINFICTHNSRRSHFSQIWAQTVASYFKIPNVYCYSGGTESTALFPKVAATLADEGFQILKLSGGENSVYAVKYDENEVPVIGFSKKYDDAFNPISGFAAVMTCSQADKECPFIAGAEKRISIPFEDPKLSDGTSQQTKIYQERSLEIAGEMLYVFSKINN
ncbi:arsenate reductase [Chryseobacterium sp. H1D6B]|uniref:arsenate-mycothiol transferase ArsC n=1 Tax=Chryseobacterium sp. H1D6B TaxID=2940588 RepID=UPI0015CD99FC|nr:protein-tyrosine-phosphatase [Chryseobacterium sp. H1D6B]MDH6250696.1 arsenate reductase [Chryseobacterium sp. H1D6B]